MPSFCRFRSLAVAPRITDRTLTSAVAVYFNHELHVWPVQRPNIQRLLPLLNPPLQLVRNIQMTLLHSPKVTRQSRVLPGVYLHNRGPEDDIQPPGERPPPPTHANTMHH